MCQESVSHLGCSRAGDVWPSRQVSKLEDTRGRRRQGHQEPHRLLQSEYDGGFSA